MSRLAKPRRQTSHFRAPKAAEKYKVAEKCKRRYLCRRVRCELGICKWDSMIDFWQSIGLQIHQIRLHEAYARAVTMGLRAQQRYQRSLFVETGVPAS